MTRLLAVLLLAGCAPFITYEPVEVDAQGYKWERGGPVGEPVYHVGLDVFLNCGLEEKAESCAVQGRGDGLCHVYLPADAAPWMEPHELRHCAGWRHPNAMLRVRPDGRVETVRWK